MELLLRFQFGSAVAAASHMLLQFMTGVIGQLAINMQRDVLSYPFAFHSNPVSRFLRLQSFKVLETLKHRNVETSFHLISANCPRNFCVARNRVFFAVSSVVCKISPTVRSFNPW